MSAQSPKIMIRAAAARHTAASVEPNDTANYSSSSAGHSC